MSGGFGGPHPTRSTAAIVVSRRCFISIPSWSYRRVCGGCVAGNHPCRGLFWLAIRIFATEGRGTKTNAQTM